VAIADDIFNFSKAFKPGNAKRRQMILNRNAELSDWPTARCRLVSQVSASQVDESFSGSAFVLSSSRVIEP
jgi:hypothetical protein